MRRKAANQDTVEPARDRQHKKLLPFFPNYLLDEVIVWYTALGILIVLASLFPAGLEEEANSLSTPAHIKPEWYFLFLFQFLKHVPRTIGVLAPGVLVALLLFLPFLDRSSKRSPRSRPVTIGVTIVMLVLIVVLSVWAWQS